MPLSPTIDVELLSLSSLMGIKKSIETARHHRLIFKLIYNPISAPSITNRLLDCINACVYKTLTAPTVSNNDLLLPSSVWPYFDFPLSPVSSRSFFSFPRSRLQIADVGGDFLPHEAMSMDPNLCTSGYVQISIRKADLLFNTA